MNLSSEPLRTMNPFSRNWTKSGLSAPGFLSPAAGFAAWWGDVCIPRKREGRHYILPLHADIQTRSRRLGLDCLTPILWHKIANGVTEAQGNGAGFYGKPYQPGAIIKNDVEYILFLRKGGEYRSPSTIQRALSMLSREEMQNWMRSSWADIKGESTRKGHPAPFPVAMAERLIRLFSFAGDIILDPFAGTGTTALAALACGRNSVSIDIEPKYAAMAEQRLRRPRSSPPLQERHGQSSSSSDQMQQFTLLDTFRSLLKEHNINTAIPAWAISSPVSFMRT